LFDISRGITYNKLITVVLRAFIAYGEILKLLFATPFGSEHGLIA
jgi:hypothetical protein